MIGRMIGRDRLPRSASFQAVSVSFSGRQACVLLVFQANSVYTRVH